MVDNTKLAAQTIINLPTEQVYKPVKTILPDGTEISQLFQLVKYPDGTQKWELTSDRIREFDESFMDTTTVPNNWNRKDTEVLERKPPSTRETKDSVSQGGLTRIDLRRILILNLGNPQSIISNKGLDSARLERYKKEKAFFTTLCMMAYEHGGEWRDARKFLNPEYPDIQTTPK